MCRSYSQRWSPATSAVVPTGPPVGVGLDRSIRAADRDRETVVALLGDHTAAGRLTLAEFEERVGRAAAARTLADLDHVLADLPAATASRAEPDRPHGRRLERWRPWLHTAIICVAIWAVTSLLAGGVIYFWPFWVIVPWGVALLAGGWSTSPRRRLVR